jgi:hypothetical protein
VGLEQLEQCSAFYLAYMDKDIEEFPTLMAKVA